MFSYQKIIFCLVLSCFALNESFLKNETEPALEKVRGESDFFRPALFLAILARNKAHTLPTYLGYLEKLDYPKDRIFVWVRSDHSFDSTGKLLAEWASKVQHLYHRVDFQHSDWPQSYPQESGPFDWPQERFQRLINLRQEALDQARKYWADYILFVDCDNFIEEPQTLNLLMAENKTVIAPMLESGESYSNFWCGVDEKGYYRRTPEYFPTLNREREGCFPVPMVHSTVLIDLRRSSSKKLYYTPPPSYLGDFDDMLTFAFSCWQADVRMHLLNKPYFGRLFNPGTTGDPFEDEIEKMVHMKLEAMVENPPMASSAIISVTEPVKSKLGFDEIYLINLVRRPERRKRMLDSLSVLGIQAMVIDAVDGKVLTEEYMKSLGLEMLPGYEDPHSLRPLTRGEIGCFLSHYNIWKDVTNRSLQQVIVFEDDVRFEYKFKQKLDSLMNDVRNLKLDWDLIYIGRKRLEVDGEPWVSGSRMLVRPAYSYWTLGYLLSLQGAKKLLAAEPLSKMLPVDEYLPIMFDQHPRGDWKLHFDNRNLNAFSAAPLLIFPTHYTGEPNYFSDTEVSTIWDSNEPTEKLKSQLKADIHTEL